MTVRKLNRDFFDLVPTFKLTLAFNNKPRITDNSYGMWSRVRLVPFQVVIPEKLRDKGLLDKLKAEGPGVLNWALDGFRMWRERGLSPPEAILAATADYRTESDRVGSFLEAATVPDPAGEILATQLYACFQGYAQAMEFRPVSQTLFGKELENRRITKGRDNTGRVLRKGIKWSRNIEWDWQVPSG
jgi:putative DNA primase/helicase